MNIHELGEELRERQRKAKYVSEQKINEMNDKEIICAYIICSECGEWLVSYEDAIELAKRSKDNNEWWQKIKEVSHHGC